MSELEGGMDSEFLSSALGTQSEKENRVIFRWREVRNNFKSKQAGRDIVEDKEFIEIISPGQGKSNFEGPVTDEHRSLYPNAYRAFKERSKALIVGTPISQLGYLPSVVHRLKALNIYTAEQVVNCSEQAKRAMGLDWIEIVKKAQSFLDNNTAEVTNLKSQNEKLGAETEALRNQVSELMRKIEELASKPVEKKKRGRPKKLTQNVESVESV